MIVQHVMPIVDFVVKFIESSKDAHQLPDDIPVRTAILHIVMDVMVRNAMAELGGGALGLRQRLRSRNDQPDLL